MSKETKVVDVPRQVIQNQLLTALDDKSKVAALLDEGDLDILIDALECKLAWDDLSKDVEDKAKRFREDLKLLRVKAFGR